MSDKITDRDIVAAIGLQLVLDSMKRAEDYLIRHKRTLPETQLEECEIQLPYWLKQATNFESQAIYEFIALSTEGNLC